MGAESSPARADVLIVVGATDPMLRTALQATCALAEVPFATTADRREGLRAACRAEQQCVVLIAAADFLGPDPLVAVAELARCAHRILLHDPPETLSLLEVFQLGVGVVVADTEPAQVLEIALDLARDRLVIDRSALLAAAAAATSRPTLTRREVDVLRLAHLRNREIAERLHVSVDTVKDHLKRINVTLGTANRVAAALTAQQMGLLQPSSCAA